MPTPRTVLDVLKRSLRLIGKLRPGRTPNTSETLEALACLNSMLDAWSGDRLYVPTVLIESYSLSGGSGVYTIGNGGTFNRASRPQKIEAASIVDSNGARSPIEVTEDSQEWSRKARGTATGTPYLIYADRGAPLVTLRVYPTPSGAETLELHVWQTLQGFEDESQLVEFPAGYEDAIVYALALRLAAEHGLPLRQDVIDMARETRRLVESSNSPTPELEGDPAVLWIGRRYY
jgi:hypothetical protein